MIYSESPRRKQINQQVSWGHWFAFANIIMAIIISSIYIIASPAPVSGLSSVYLLLTWFGHISFITFFGFIVLLLPLCYQVTNQTALKAIGSIIAATALALLAFDALLFNKTGFHISLSSAALLRNEAQGQISAFSWLQWFYLVLLFIIWLMFQLVIANAIFKRIKQFQKIRIGKYATSAFLACFVISHAIHVWADARLYAPVLQQDNMFPLSYPATAKTLMSRAGLLDLQDYKQRQTLQFSADNFVINYPPEPIYCSVDASQKVVFLRVTDALDDFSMLDTSETLKNTGFHFINERLTDDYLGSLLFGMPQLFVEGIKDKRPVLLDLPEAFDVNIKIFSDKQIDPDYSFQSSVKSDFDAFNAALQQQDSGLFIAEVNRDNLASIKLDDLIAQASLIVVARDNSNINRLFTNLGTTVEMSTTEDIAPTLITAIGCAAQASQFSTGQSIQAPTRNWLVSTQGRHLVVIHNGLITEVSADGSFEIRDYLSNEKVLTEIDTNLLSRSIKHFTKFTQK